MWSQLVDEKSRMDNLMLLLASVACCLAVAHELALLVVIFLFLSKVTTFKKTVVLCIPRPTNTAWTT